MKQNIIKTNFVADTGDVTEIITVSDELFNFFVALHNESTRKTKWLKERNLLETISKFREERAEVDEELDSFLLSINENTTINKLINEEILHETIWCMKLRTRLQKCYNEKNIL